MSITLALLMSVAPPVQLDVAPPAISVDLDYRSYRNWKYSMPSEEFRSLTGGVPVPHAGGDLFACEVRGSGLTIDTDGDGTLDQVIEGSLDETTGLRTARVVLKGKKADGQDFTYAVRLQDAGKGWQWASGGAMVGMHGDTKIQIFDLNGNGQFGDVGADAMIMGVGTRAQILSSSVHLGADLHSLSIDGKGLELTPFAGETGTLDLDSKIETKGKLMHAWVRSEDGKHHFDLAGASQGKSVPAGTYHVVGGLIGLGKSVVQVDGSEMKTLEVPAGGQTTMQWGGPVRAEFDYKREGTQVTFDPAQVWYTGAAGERYVGWDPIGKSPEFTIVEKKLGTEIEKALFPGSC